MDAGVQRLFAPRLRAGVVLVLGVVGAVLLAGDATARQGPSLPVKTTKSDASSQLLAEGEAAARQAIREEGRRRGWDKHPDVIRAMALAADTAMADLLLKEVLDRVKVTDLEVRKKYEEVRSTLGPLEFKVSYLQTVDPSIAQQLALRASTAPSLRVVAAEAGSHATSHELDWVSFPMPPVQGRTQWLSLPMAEAIVRLQAGETSLAPVLDGGKWHVIRLDAIRPTNVPKFDDVQQDIRTMLERTRASREVAATIARLLAKPGSGSNQ